MLKHTYEVIHMYMYSCCPHILIYGHIYIFNWPHERTPTFKSPVNLVILRAILWACKRFAFVCKSIERTNEWTVAGSVGVCTLSFVAASIFMKWVCHIVVQRTNDIKIDDMDFIHYKILMTWNIETIRRVLPTGGHPLHSYSWLNYETTSPEQVVGHSG